MFLPPDYPSEASSERAFALLEDVETTTSEIHLRADRLGTNAARIADDASAIVAEAEAAVIRDLHLTPDRVTELLEQSKQRLESLLGRLSEITLPADQPVVTIVA
ncbi:MAG: hypothetical protein CMJ83_02480 [Planctomycetes bacterium]|nr:hypothetical protein [Planctomycetota bacterium]